jgi:hypothetical protein
VIKYWFMEKFRLSFDFKGRACQATILTDEKSAGREFTITELDEELERILSGNHIVREINGALEADVLPAKKEQTELKLIIASRLSEYLSIPCFVGNECLTPRAHAENWQELHPLFRHDPYRGGPGY